MSPWGFESPSRYPGNGFVRPFTKWATVAIDRGHAFDAQTDAHVVIGVQSYLCYKMPTLPRRRKNDACLRPAASPHLSQSLALHLSQRHLVVHGSDVSVPHLPLCACFLDAKYLHMWRIVPARWCSSGMQGIHTYLHVFNGNRQ